METTLKRPNSCLRRLNPVKHKVSVCTGSACTRRGGGHALHEIKEMLGIYESPVSADGNVRLDAIPCSGNCDMAPLVIANKTLVPVSELGSIRALIGYKTPKVQKPRAKRQPEIQPVLA